MRRAGNVLNMTAPEQLSETIRQVLPSVRADLERLVRIPSVSADPAAAPHLRDSACEAAELLSQAGLPDVQILTAGGGQPAVLAHARPARRPHRPALRAPRRPAAWRPRRLEQRPVRAHRT